MKISSFIGFAAVVILATAMTAPAATPAKPGAPKLGEYKGKSHNAIPDNAFGVYSFDEATKEAVKKKKALAIIVTDERADDAAVKVAGAKAFWALEDDAVMVVLRSSTAGQWTRLPDNVQAAIKSADLGKEYPRLVITNDDASTLLAGMASPKLIGLDDKSFNKFGKEVKKLNATKTASTEFPPPSLEAPKPAAPAPAPAPAAGTPATPATPAPAATPPAPAAPAAPVGLGGSAQEEWTNAAGQTIKATLLEVKGTQITFLMANGNKVPYELNKLSPASQKRVQELSAAK
jgi:hypothetical protein